MADAKFSRPCRLDDASHTRAMIWSHAAIACVSCNPELQARIFTPQFIPVVAMIACQFFVAAGMAALLHLLK